MNRNLSVALAGMLVMALLAATAIAFTPEQAAQGKELYTQYCALCHGPDARGGVVPQQFGQAAGKKVPPLAGPGALQEHENAHQVYEFSKSKMPLGHPGMLADEQYLTIVAFALQANGIQPGTQPLTPDSAKDIDLSGAKQ
jgi:S-disulfanyl-L-cysteine oxidoreductase SoxD